MFSVTLDFGDDAVKRPRIFDSYSDLSSYLESIPNMIGFHLSEKTQILITLIPKT